MSADEPPLCVDLDGTLFVGDTLRISLWQIARRAPWNLPLIGIALLKGKAEFKRVVSTKVIPDPAKLRWRPTVVAFVREQHSTGRRVILTTAADRPVAEAVAAHLGCFDGIVASDGVENAKGSQKVEAIRRFVGPNIPFDYMGDTRADLPVFAAARLSYLVSPSHGLREAAERVGRIERIFDEE